MKKAVLFILPVLMCLTGCGFFVPNHETTTYCDLGIPKQIRTVPIYVDNFVSVTGERHRIAWRETPYMVDSTDLKKWILSPGSMLSRYLQIAYRNETNSPAVSKNEVVRVSGKVLVFEASEGEAQLGVLYTLTYKTKSVSKMVLIHKKLAESNIQSFLEAMSNAAWDFANLIAKEAENIVKRG